MSTIYVVMGSTGEYSDREQWPVMAYFEKHEAEKHCDRATYAAHAIKKRNDADKDEGWRYVPERHGTNPHDPGFRLDYTGTDYYVMAVELARAPSPERSADE